jgi:hypothetical protein
MRKFLMGVVWFFGIWFAASMICSLILTAVGGYQAGRAGHPEQAVEKGRIASEEFSEEYGTLVLFGAFVASIIGTATEILPGTRAKRSETPPIISKTLPPPLPAGTVIMPKEIFVGRGTQQFGPFTTDDIKKFLVEGRLLITDLAWYEGAPGWEPISKIAILNTPLTPSSPPPPPPADPSYLPPPETTSSSSQNEESGSRPSPG